MASLSLKEVGADQMLGPEFLVNVTASSLSIDTLFNKTSSVILMGTKC